MHCIPLIFLAALLLSFTPDSSLSQDWLKWQPTDGVPVRQGNMIEWLCKTATRTAVDRSGETAMVWEDNRFGYRNVGLQVIEPDGNLRF